MGRRWALTAAVAAALGPALLWATPAVQAAPLPDDRSWELVTPADKGGGGVPAPGQVFGGGLIRAAASGAALTYTSPYAFADPQGAAYASQYIARRTAGGWVSENLSSPSEAGAYEVPDGSPYKLFSPDLSRAAAFDGARYSLRGSAGQLLATVPEAAGIALDGASSDLGALIFSTGAGLERFTAAAGLVAVGAPPGAALAAPAGAVSADGSRIYFTLGGDLYLRDGTLTRSVDAAAGGGGSLEAASPACSAPPPPAITSTTRTRAA